LGIKAAEASHPVLFDSATGWINRLAQAHAAGSLDRELRRLKRYRALIIDISGGAGYAESCGVGCAGFLV